jgi:hypothetical protein
MIFPPAIRSQPEEFGRQLRLLCQILSAACEPHLIDIEITAQQ